MNQDSRRTEANHAALRRVLASFCERANAEKTVRKMFRDWKRNIHLQMTDTPDTWTVQVADLSAGFREEPVEPRHMLITSTEEILVAIFTGKANPAAEYAAGRVKFNGSAKDEMKLDAIIDLIWR